MAGYTIYAVISPERKKVICDFISANGPHVTPATSRNLCNRSIKANVMMICTALLQAGVTCFVLVAYGMKQPLSSLQLLSQVQAPTAITPNRLDLGITYNGDGGIPLFSSTIRGVRSYQMLHMVGFGHGSLTKRVRDRGLSASIRTLVSIHHQNPNKVRVFRACRGSLEMLTSNFFCIVIQL